MNPPLHRIAAISTATAYLASAALQVYRARQGTGLPVDRFSVATGAGYAVLLALGLALLTDRRWVWWANLLACAALYLQAPFGYYPWVYGSRPLEVWDWLEGTWFTALLFLTVACAVLRLTGATAGRRDAGARTP